VNFLINVGRDCELLFIDYIRYNDVALLLLLLLLLLLSPPPPLPPFLLAFTTQLRVLASSFLSFRHHTL
jgi:hypothetical protein